MVIQSNLFENEKEVSLQRVKDFGVLRDTLVLSAFKS